MILNTTYKPTIAINRVPMFWTVRNLTTDTLEDYITLSQADAAKWVRKHGQAGHNYQIEIA